LLSSYERTQGFLRFGAELGESSRQILTMGERVLAFFDQPTDKSIPFNLQLALLALLITGMWDGKNLAKIVGEYETNADLVKMIDGMVEASFSMNKLIEKTRLSADKILPFLTT
jgi:F0F1-type ATP synthase alpha subunit